jgi:DDE superfamily endonuclease
MVEIFSSEPLYSKYIALPPPTHIHENIHENPHFWPYFKDAISAIDGSHIPTAPPSQECPAYHNWKGFISQNCLFACNFNMKFTYVMSGWEGSATDAHVYQDACESGLVLPTGKYFLGDASYPSAPGLLVPYCNTHYHLAE